jgi:large subunit ribosomal protein L29
MRAEEIRSRDNGELERRLDELKRELFDLRFQWQSEEEADHNRRRKVRREIARIKTVLRERELAEAGG